MQNVSHPSSPWDLLKLFNEMEEEAKMELLMQGRHCIADGITLKQFHTKCNKNDGEGCFRWEFQDGKAWIYEIPHFAHARAAGRVMSSISFGLGEDNMDDLAMAASPRCDNNKDTSMEPDGSICSDHPKPGPNQPGAADACGNRWPNIIVEVAYHETEEHVLRKAEQWLTACDNDTYGVQQVIVIKMGTSVGTDGHRTMKAWRYERNNPGNPVEEIEFGNHGANNGATARNLPGMQLHVPTASIFHPNPVPPGVPHQTIIVDLFYVRRDIERSFNPT